MVDKRTWENKRKKDKKVVTDIKKRQCLYRHKKQDPDEKNNKVSDVVLPFFLLFVGIGFFGLWFVVSLLPRFQV